ncbi:MAG TPA: hypothetical protein VGC39_08065 [Candidatus Methylacidiphilales bacterium]
MIIVFSKDRAFQLEACLRTLLAQCGDAHDVPIRILWTSSSEDHRQAYAILRKELTGYGTIEFVRESDFRRDLLEIIGDFAPGSWQGRIAHLLFEIGRVPALRGLSEICLTPLLPGGPVMFVVDDTLFLRPFRFDPCARHLLASTEYLAFSLRLGQGVTRSYIGHCGQQVPPMTVVNDKLGIYQYRWPDSEIDFEYPLEVSSSVLNLRLILARLLRKKWKSPNSLELALANMAGRYKRNHPLLLTFGEPRAVSAPLNVVQHDFKNPHGGQERYHPDALCRLFLQGGRADLTRLDQIHTNAVHIEVDLLPSAQ